MGVEELGELQVAAVGQLGPLLAEVEVLALRVAHGGVRLRRAQNARPRLAVHTGASAVQDASIPSGGRMA